MRTKTVIVGGGMAGLSCALKLLEANQDFRLVTDSLGGRIMYSAQAGVNFGAYFVMSSYTHAKKLLTKGAWINPLDSCFHINASVRFGALSWHTLGLLPELVRFYRALREFSAHYEAYKVRCLSMPQKSALAADEYMASLFAKPALQFALEKKFRNLSADYVSKFAYACTGASLEQISALDFLNVSMGMITPIHCVIFDGQAVAKKLGDHLVIDTISSVEQRDGQYFLNGQAGNTYQADHVIIATPAAVTRDLLGLAEIRQASRIYVFHVKAELKPVYRQHAMNLFPYTSEIMLIVKQHDGSYLVYAREKAIDLNQICERFELLASVAWEKAMYIQGKAYLEQQYGDGLFVAGDHNGLGLEPAAISGIYAANQILGKEV